MKGEISFYPIYDFYEINKSFKGRKLKSIIFQIVLFMELESLKH